MDVNTGTSGSGKTTLLREVIRYLASRGKILFVVDLHGDLQVPGVPENHIEITARNPKYGINPFEFYRCPRNGGVAVQRDNIVQLFKKSFIPNMGPMQEKVLKRLITDTYAMVGISDGDVATWENPLPTMEDMKSLADTILESINTGFSFEFVKRFQDADKTISILQRKIEQCKNDLIALEQSDDVSPAAAKAQDSIAEMQGKIEGLVEKLDMDWATYKRIRLFGYSEAVVEGENPSPIDMGFYGRKDACRCLETLSVYIAALYETKVFHSEVPPVVAGINRFDISGLDHSLQVFFTEILIQKVFRAKKLRGEYRKYAVKDRGERVDTFFVIDESKLVMPAGRDKESPFHGMNRVASESRKYGLGLVLASQKPTHYPQELLSNIDLKVVLTTAANDIQQAKKLLGVQDETMFRQGERFGVAMISVGAGDFESVCLPWVDTKGWNGESSRTAKVEGSHIKMAI